MISGKDSRRLTPAEIGALPHGLVAAIDVTTVELVPAHSWVSHLARLIGRGTQIVVRGRRIFWPGLQQDFSASPVHLAMLAHELVHVWQYANGMTLLRYVVRERGLYRYQLDGRPFEAYGYEQQAAMVEDWVRLKATLPPRWGQGVTLPRLEDTIPFSRP